MKLNELRDHQGATHTRKRIGRGIGSGTGKTGGRGVKGQKSRSGVAVKGFEGGQMPIYRRLPKRGFFNIFSNDFNEISIGRIQDAINRGKIDPSSKIDQELLCKCGLLRRFKRGVRLLGDGYLDTSVHFEVSGASKAAISKVKEAGGSVKVLAAAD